MTCGSASQAMEEAKQIKEDITVKLETNTSKCRHGKSSFACSGAVQRIMIVECSFPLR